MERLGLPNNSSVARVLNSGNVTTSKKNSLGNSIGSPPHKITLNNFSPKLHFHNSHALNEFNEDFYHSSTKKFSINSGDSNDSDSFVIERKTQKFFEDLESVKSSIQPNESDIFVNEFPNEAYIKMSIFSFSIQKHIQE